MSAFDSAFRSFVTKKIEDTSTFHKAWKRSDDEESVIPAKKGNDLWVSEQHGIKTSGLKDGICWRFDTNWGWPSVFMAMLKGHVISRSRQS